VLSRFFFFKKESVLLADFKLFVLLVIWLLVDLLASTIWLNFLIYVTVGFIGQYNFVEFLDLRYWGIFLSVLTGRLFHQ